MKTNAPTWPDADPATLPFPRSYWARPGRLAAGCYPGGQTAAESEAKLRGLARCGVSRVVNLMEADEVGHGGRLFVPYQAELAAHARTAGREVGFERLSIRDLSVPTVTTMRAILDHIDAELDRGEVVYVHCWGGRGRTGTVIGCHFVRHGIAPADEALALLARLTAHARALFHTVPETPEQQAFVRAWRAGL